jgi:deoxyribodipyrimidine photolyase-related protein
MPRKTRHRVLRLILGDQLNLRHSWFRKVDPQVTYVLMEVKQETDYVRHHIQKVAAFFAAMRAFADQLREKGHDVLFLRLDDPENRHSFEANIKHVLRPGRVGRFEYQLPDEYRLDQQLKRLAADLAQPAAAVESEHFFCRRRIMSELFPDRERFLMETFYREMRRRHNILMNDGEPIGDRWNFDAENRRAYDGRLRLPSPRLFRNDVAGVVEMIERTGVSTFGEIDPVRLIWPITRRQALTALRYFTRNLLPHFGTYQDAMTTESWSLFHSRLSFALNTKMISPHEAIKAAVSAWQSRPDEISLSQIEGFVRQILGWREFIRGCYWHFMPGYAKLNYLQHQRPLPHYYWDADTRMHCLRMAIKQSLDYAYAHHIQRLMITGNFALLAGIDPDQVDRWYLGIYIDAVQWVELPNTRGMSQFADGGLVATKPYVSSANYINKMSDYCRECHYSSNTRHGENACPLNNLYWHFLERHSKAFRKNRRM